MLRSDPVNVLDQNLQEITAFVVRTLSFVRESVQFAKRALVDAEAGEKLRG